MCYDSNNHYQMATQLLIKVPKIHSYVAIIDYLILCIPSINHTHTHSCIQTHTHTHTHIAMYIPIVVTRIEDVRGPSPAPVLHETSIM